MAPLFLPLATRREVSGHPLKRSTAP